MGRVGGTAEVSKAAESGFDMPVRSGKPSDFSLHFFASSRSQFTPLCTVTKALLSLPLLIVQCPELISMCTCVQSPVAEKSMIYPIGQVHALI
jgi:hypothetical protein